MTQAYRLNTERPLASAVMNEDTSAVTLAVIAIELFDYDWLEWEPTTIIIEFERALGIGMTMAAGNKVMQARELLKNNEFFQELPKFINGCHALAGEALSVDLADIVVDVSDLAWSVVEAILLAPLSADELQFSEEICKYIGYLLDREGFGSTPSVLSFAIREEPDAALNDAEFMQQTFTISMERVEDVNQEVESSMAALVRQLQSLPLRSAKKQATNIAQLIERRFNELQSASTGRTGKFSDDIF